MLLILSTFYITQFMLCGTRGFLSDELGSCRRNGQWIVLRYTTIFLEERRDHDKRQTRRRTSVWIVYIRNNNHNTCNTPHHLTEISHSFDINIA